jgi:flagellar basal body-associated protein FliL
MEDQTTDPIQPKVDETVQATNSITPEQPEPVHEDTPSLPPKKSPKKLYLIIGLLIMLILLGAAGYELRRHNNAAGNKVNTTAATPVISKKVSATISTGLLETYRRQYLSANE